MLRVGDPAPTFRAEDHRGHSVDLSAMCARGPVVLFFYPADFTPVCTREACHFRDAQEELSTQGVQIVGISADPPENHRAFAQKYGLTYPLLTDKGDLADRYLVARPFGLRARRVTYVLDREGLVRGVFHHELRAKKHVQQVRKLLQALASAG